MDKIYQGLIFGLILISITCIIVAGFEHERLDVIENAMTAQQAQIAAVKTQSAQAVSMVQAAHVQADQALNQANKNAQTLMTVKVPTNCEAAVAWAVAKAKKIPQ